MDQYYLISNIVIANVDTNPTAPLLKSLDERLQILYHKHGFRQLQSCVSDFLYTLLARQRSPGFYQRWEKENLGREFAQMSCMRHFLHREYKWLQLRKDLLELLDQTVWDGELHLASIDDFLDEIERELYRQKKLFYQSCLERCSIYKEELIAQVMHPSRIAKILDAEGFEGLLKRFGE